MKRMLTAVLALSLLAACGAADTSEADANGTPMVTLESGHEMEAKKLRDLCEFYSDEGEDTLGDVMAQKAFDEEDCDKVME